MKEKTEEKLEKIYNEYVEKGKVTKEDIEDVYFFLQNGFNKLDENQDINEYRAVPNGVIKVLNSLLKTENKFYNNLELFINIAYDDGDTREWLARLKMDCLRGAKQNNYNVEIAQNDVKKQESLMRWLLTSEPLHISNFN